MADGAKFMDLSGLTAFITGSSRGIGFATAKLLKELGAEVIVHGSSPDTVGKAALELGCKGVVANLFDDACVETIDNQLKVLAPAGIDILVNNAGVTRDALFLRQSQEQWDEVGIINIKRVVQLTRLLLPPMTKKGFGRIINMSSIVAHTGNIGQTNYVTTKSAVEGFTRSLCKEVARRGVTVNAVAPGFILTDMTAKMTDEAKAAFAKQVPAARFGEAAEIASAVAYLASREAGYITGTTLHVNGGMFV